MFGVLASALSCHIAKITLWHQVFFVMQPLMLMFQRYGKRIFGALMDGKSGAACFGFSFFGSVLILFSISSCRVYWSLQVFHCHIMTDLAGENIGFGWQASKPILGFFPPRQ